MLIIRRTTVTHSGMGESVISDTRETIRMKLKAPIPRILKNSGLGILVSLL